MNIHLFRNLFKRVPGDTVWGSAIVTALKGGKATNDEVKTLVETLKSQAEDNPELMKKVLGFDLLLLLSMEEGATYEIDYRFKNQGLTRTAFKFQGVDLGGAYCFAVQPVLSTGAPLSAFCRVDARALHTINPVKI